jgi:hypothetical protein
MPTETLVKALLLLRLLCRRLGLLRLRFARRLGLWRCGRLRWRKDQVQRVAFLACAEFNDRFIAEVLNQAVENFTAESLARHLASTEEDGGFHLVAFAEEAQHVVLFGLVIVLVHVDPELHFLDRNGVLVFLGFALALFLLVEILAEIHDSADRRLCGGRNFDEIQTTFAGDLERFEWRHDTELAALIINYAYFACADALIGADKAFIDMVLRWAVQRQNYSM